MANRLQFARDKFNGINGNSKSKDEWDKSYLYLNFLGGSEKVELTSGDNWNDLKAAVK